MNLRKLFSRLIFMVLFLPLLAFGQGEVANYLKIGFGDAALLGTAYISPLTRVYGINANSNWLQTARALEPFRMNFSAGVSAIEITDKMSSFDPNTLGLKLVEFSTPGGLKFPTVFGTAFPKGDVTLYGVNPVNNQRESWATITPPPGLSYSWFASPNVQFSLGVGGETEVMLRYFPKNKFVLFDNIEGTVGMYGLGLKHNLTQYFWRDLKKRPFDFALFGSYSRLYSDIGLNLLPDSADTRLKLMVNPNTFAGQYLSLRSINWQVGGMLSRKLGLLTVYTSLAWQFSENHIDFMGQYPYIQEYIQKPGPDFNKLSVGAIQDPLQMLTSHKALSFQAGMRLRFFYFMLMFAEYSRIQELNMFNAGLGFAIE